MESFNSLSELLELGRKKENGDIGRDPRRTAFTHRSGIVSFLPETEESRYPHLSTDELDRLAAAVEQQSLVSGLDTLDRHPKRDAVLFDLFDTSSEGWQHLVTDRIHGRCLDLYPGFGKRTAMLATLADELYAVGPNLAQLRILSARAEADVEAALTTVHANTNTMPFPKESFDTIIADVAGSSRSDGRPLPEVIADLKRLLVDDGVLILTANGLTGRDRLGEYLGRGRAATGSRPSFVESIRAALRSNARGYRTLLSRGETGVVDLYALLPNRDTLSVAFRVDDTEAARWCINQYVGSAGVSSFVSVAERLGILKQCYPSYLAVWDGSPGGSHRSKPRRPTGHGRVLLPGYSRSVTLNLVDGQLDRIRKVPNGLAYSDTTERENNVLNTLGDTDHPITETLPSGGAGSSPFGPTRTEMPASGVPLVNTISRNPIAFRNALRVGLTWLGEFQGAFVGDRITKSCADVHTDLQCAHPAVGRPPRTAMSVELPVTPSHGDYHPHNVLVEEGSISCVLDWEFATLEGNPVIDLGMLLFNLFEYTFSDIEHGFEAVFHAETPYAAAFRTVVGEYLSTIDISPQAAAIYLPHACIRILRLRPYTPWTSTFVDWTNVAWREAEAVRDRFEEATQYQSTSDGSR